MSNHVDLKWVHDYLESLSCVLRYRCPALDGKVAVKVASIKARLSDTIQAVEKSIEETQRNN